MFYLKSELNRAVNSSDWEANPKSPLLIHSYLFTVKKKICKDWATNLSLSSQLASGIVGRPGTLKWLAWRFCAVLLDTIQTSFLLSGLLHSLEWYSVMHLATSSFQWSSSLSLICKGDKQETYETLHTGTGLKYNQDVKCFFLPTYYVWLYSTLYNSTLEFSVGKIKSFSFSLDTSNNLLWTFSQYADIL